MAKTSAIATHCHPRKPNPLPGPCTAGKNTMMTSATFHSLLATKTPNAVQTDDIITMNDSITTNIPTKTKWPPWPGTSTEPPSADLQATHTLPPLPQPPPPPHTPPTDRGQEISIQVPRPPLQPPLLLWPALPSQCLKSQAIHQTEDHLPLKWPGAENDATPDNCQQLTDRHTDQLSPDSLHISASDHHEDQPRCPPCWNKELIQRCNKECNSISPAKIDCIYPNNSTDSHQTAKR